jgi:hypothetical protein
MGEGALGSLAEEFFADGVDIDSSPEALQVVESAAQLCRRQTPSFAHSAQGGHRLNVSDCGRSDAVGIAVGPLRLLGALLVDQQLYEGAGIEVETQRRPSET